MTQPIPQPCPKCDGAGVRLVAQQTIFGQAWVAKRCDCGMSRGRTEEEQG